MEEEKTLTNEVLSETYDAADRPFDFVGADVGTALICETDASVKEKIVTAIKTLDYQITEPASAKEALKNMRYHTYNIVIVNENFDTDNPDNNEVLNYLASLNMSTRRDIFVTMLSNRFRTMDNMAAFNNSVNLIINTKNIDDAVTIIKGAVADNDAFYYVFKETLKKKGRI